MQTASTEKFLAKLLRFTGAFTTIFLLSGGVTDPVNAPKFVAIGTLGCSALLVFLLSPLRRVLRAHKLLISLLLAFNFFMLSSAIFSQAPLVQLLYGAYGRNNGILTYFFLSMLMLSALGINSQKGFQSLVKGLLFAGVVNLVYCMWVIIFGDFISWSNPYGNILGTLGNPNFIGAFLGIIFTALSAIVLDRRSTKNIRIISIVAIPICAFEIISSHAIQGRVVAAVGTSVVCFLYLRSRFNNLILVGYTFVVTIFGSFALAGALQVGPLTRYIYKYSVSLRGQYWLAGWNTGESHPFTGVGMDAFGDWYRRMRDPQALITPGVNTVVNAAHNVPIDIFAFGGWPLFLSYLSIMAIAAVSILRIMKRSKKFDLTFVVLASCWVGYQLQSIISINQIGLAVWGWLLSGSLVAYERFTRSSGSEQVEGGKQNQKSKSSATTNLPAQIPLVAATGGLIGLLIALPPLSADIKWRSSQVSQNLPSLQESMSKSYFNPPNSMKYWTNIQALEASQIFGEAHRYASEAVKWNPDSFESWKILYFLKKSTQEEKAIALKNMRRLDPLNPDVTLSK